MAKTRIRYLAVLLGAAVFFFCFNGYLSLYVILTVLFLPVVSLLLSLPGALGLKLDLSLDAVTAQKGREVPLKLTVKNRLPYPSGRLGVTLTVRNTLTDETQEEHFSFAAYPGTQSVCHKLASPSCGQVVCGLSKGRSQDYLGLFFLPLRLPKDRPSVLFFPAPHQAVLSLGHAAMPDSEGDTYSQTKPGDDPSELFGLREYREGDRLSRVHWKLSQKLDQTLVKELGLPITDDILFLIETNGSGQETDALLDVFATLSGFLTEREAAHRVGFWDKKTERLSILEIAGPEDQRSVLGALLAAGRAGDLPALFEQELPTGVSHALYLSCRPGEETAGFLQLLLPSTRLSVLRVAEECPGLKLPAGTELLDVPPDKISEALSGFIL